MSELDHPNRLLQLNHLPQVVLALLHAALQVLLVALQVGDLFIALANLGLQVLPHHWYVSKQEHAAHTLVDSSAVAQALQVMTGVRRASNY